MPTITDVIDLIHPASDAVGIILSDTIWVLFDREVDTLDEGNFFIEGPDTDSFIGPDVGLNLPNVSDSGSNDQLESPGYKGILQGTISFQKINLADLNAYTGPSDTTGNGALWRTKAIFTPKFPLQKETDYTVYITGDEDVSNAELTGIRSRTVFDGIALGGNTGSGVTIFSGSFTGSATSDTIHIKTTIAGASGEAFFTWWFASAPLSVFGPIKTDRYNSILLNQGVKVKFGNGTFNINDEYTVLVKKAVTFTGNSYWSFTTGTGSIQTIPVSTSTSIIGDLPAPLIPSAFVVTNMLPVDRASNLPVTTKRIVLEFNSSIDSSTVISDNVSIIGTPVNGDETIFATREIYKDITVTGSKIIIDI